MAGPPKKKTVQDDQLKKLTEGTVDNIGLRNIADLRAHHISRVGNRIMHIMEFHDGGTCEVTFVLVGDNRAKVELFQGNHVGLSRVGNDIVISQFASLK